MRKLVLLLCVACCVVAVGMVVALNGDDVSAQAAGKDGVFIHIKSGPEDTHSVMMALRMATIMTEDKDVLVYFDVKGIDVVLADGPNLKMAPFGESKQVLASLVAKGATVMACPGCLQVAGKTPDDLMEGIQVANKAAFFEFTEGRILTLDY
jgi:predicted peroxiredoxin